jgi:hypothetical protein
MKKDLLYAFIFTTLLGLSGFGQSLINGDMEAWTGETPDGWTISDNITQGTDIVHGGSFSAKHTSASGSKKLRQNIEDVVGGTQYTISYWYYDNDPAARTRIWAYWMTDGTTLDDNADELRPGTYSEDNAAWQQYNVTLTAPAAANQFRFEVRVYKQDGNTGGAVYYDDFSFTGDVSINPEPSNYPSGFVANTSGSSITLNFTDATGEQLPLAYVIYAATSPALPTPEDGTPVENDTDLSDGSGAMNVAYGATTYTFANLEGATTYYFSIYPYTNTGENIDFKTDGTVPTANATTEDITTIFNQTFDDGFGDWTTVSIVGDDQVWIIDEAHGDPMPCAKMSGYSGGSNPNEDWLISPAFSLNDTENEILTFSTAMNYTGDDLMVMIADDYVPGDDPNEADWQDLTATLSGGSWAWTESGDIDLNAYSGTEMYIAFKYTSDDAGSATWEIDNIKLVAGGGSSVIPEPTNYPTDFTSNCVTTDIQLFWTDAVGEQLPENYLVVAYTTAFGGVADGQPIADDLDFSDGFAAMNIAYGQETAFFAGTLENTTYTVKIYPYTNSGTSIDYKNDGSVPELTIQTGNSFSGVIFNLTFDNGFDNWTTYSVIGDDQVWSIDENHGSPVPCGKMSGYAGGSNPNEDWLISPQLTGVVEPLYYLYFETSMNYSGPPLELLYSYDYTAGDPNDATWETLSFNPSPGGWEWTSAAVNLSSLISSNIRFAFKYTSTSDASATWEIDNIKLVGVPEGINDNKNIVFSIYPNPTTGDFYIENNSNEKVLVTIFNLLGEEIYSYTNNSTLSQVSLNLEAGTYLIQLKGSQSGNISRQKLIVK